MPKIYVVECDFYLTKRKAVAAIFSTEEKATQFVSQKESLLSQGLETGRQACHYHVNPCVVHKVEDNWVVIQSNPPGESYTILSKSKTSISQHKLDSGFPGFNMSSEELFLDKYPKLKPTKAQWEIEDGKFVNSLVPEDEITLDSRGLAYLNSWETVLDSYKDSREQMKASILALHKELEELRSKNKQLQAAIEETEGEEGLERILSSMTTDD